MKIPSLPRVSPSVTRLSFLLAAALLLTGVGCAKRIDVVMRHPLEVGTVDQPNTVTRNNGWHATLLRADPEEICFDVALTREQPHSPPTVDLRALSVLMKTQGDWYRDAQVTEVLPAEVSTFQGTVPQTFQEGTIRECESRDEDSGECNRWVERPREVVRYVPATFYRASGGGKVCFPNHGRFTLAGDRIVLSVERVNFRWGFESIVASAEQDDE